MAEDLEQLENYPVEVIASTNHSYQVEQQDTAALNTQIVTARRYPRNLTRVIENAILVATMDKAAAEDCTYTLSKGGKTISGPSVNLARIIVQNYQNIRVENKVVGFDATHVTCEATCFDLENNVAVRTQIKKAIVDKDGSRFSYDLQVITGNAGNAIAYRNAVFSVVPKEIVNKVYNAVIEKIAGKLSDPAKLAAKRSEIVKGFQTTYHSLKITEDEIAKAVGRQSMSHITKEDVVKLIGLEKAIQAGELSAEEVFKGKQGLKVINLPADQDTKKEERILALIDAAKSVQELEKHKALPFNEALRNAYDAKFAELKNKK